MTSFAVSGERGADSASEKLAKRLEDVRLVFRRLQRARAILHSSYEHALEQTTAEHGRRVRELEAEFNRALEQLNTERQARITQVREQYADEIRVRRVALEGLVADHPWRFASWHDPIWRDYSPPSDSVAQEISLGQFVVGTGDVALAVPYPAAILGHQHLFVASAPDQSEQGRELLLSALLRLVLASTPGSVQLKLVDAGAHGASFAPLLRLPTLLRGPRAWSRPEDIEQQLGSLVSHVEDVIQNRLRNTYRSVLEYNAEQPGVAVPFIVLAVMDFPEGFTERSAAHLLALARSGPRAGVHVMATIDETAPQPRGIDVASLLELDIAVRIGDGQSATGSERLLVGHAENT